MKQVQAITKQVSAIVRVTCHEILREKALWASLVFSAILIMISIAMSKLSFAEPWRIALDFGSAGISLAGALLSITVGSSIIASEVKNKNLLLTLTKPLDRWQYVLGRAGGLFTVVTLNVLVMEFAAVLIFISLGGHFHRTIVYQLILQLPEFYILGAISVFFSTFTTATLAAVFGLGIWLIGHAMDAVILTIERIEVTALESFLLVLVKLLPDFTLFDLKPQLSHGILVPIKSVFLSASYGVIFCGFVISASCFVFSRREL